MAVVALDREAARAAISAAAGRFTALLRETDDIERPAAGTNWTVAETAAHVSCMFTGIQRGDRRGTPAPTPTVPGCGLPDPVGGLQRRHHRHGRPHRRGTAGGADHRWGTTVPGACGGGRSADGV